MTIKIFKSTYMKQLAIILLFILFACGGNKTEATKHRKPIAMQEDGKETFLFKVDGLQDSIIADSIWKMIFKYQTDIDKLVISKPDSSVVITIDPKNMTGDMLATEIEKRGGKVLN
jgi:hypothetical protein